MRLFLGSETAFKAEEPFSVVYRNVRNMLTNFENADPFDDRYGKEFSKIAIITMILGEGADNLYKERQLVRHKKKDADIRLKIDYEKFINTNEEMQTLLYVKNIIDSIKVVEERKKDDFKGLKLIDDILSTLNLTKEQINL